MCLRIAPLELHFIYGRHGDANEKSASATVPVEVRGTKQWERVGEQFWKLKLDPHRDTRHTLTNISRMAARGEREMTPPSL